MNLESNRGADGNLPADDNSFKCYICNRSFTNINELTSHKEEHKEKCTICKKSFAHKSSLKLHMVTHTDVRQFRCHLCQDTFRRSSDLYSHMLIHTDVKPFRCDLCQKPFKRSFELKSHMLIHTDVKPFRCDLCQKPFKRSKELKLHMFTHTDVKPFRCDLCQQTFVQRSNLCTHIRKRRKCNICSTKCCTLHDLKRHLQKKHTNETLLESTRVDCSKEITSMELLKHCSSGSNSASKVNVATSSNQIVYDHNNAIQSDADSVEKDINSNQIGNNVNTNQVVNQTAPRPNNVIQWRVHDQPGSSTISTYPSLQQQTDNVSEYSPAINIPTHDQFNSIFYSSQLRNYAQPDNIHQSLHRRYVMPPNLHNGTNININSQRYDFIRQELAQRFIQRNKIPNLPEASSQIRNTIPNIPPQNLKTNLPNILQDSQQQQQQHQKPN